MGLLDGSRRRRRCCKSCMIILTVALILFICGRYCMFKPACSDDDSMALITDLCNLYKKNKVAGSMCEPLCVNSTLRYNTCRKFRRSKIVLFMECDTCGEDREYMKAVFKTTTDVDKLKHPESNWISSIPEESPAESLVYYTHMIESRVKTSFQMQFGIDVSWHKDILTYVWGWDFKKYIKENRNSGFGNSFIVAAESILSLTEQFEYLMLRALEEHTFVPKIYGTCGPVYVVEHTQKWDYEFIAGYKYQWKDRANYALKLIDIIQRLDTDLEQTLHLCDAKIDNFGMRENGDVTLIDVDCAHFDHKLNEHFFHRNCSVHEDCDFLRCRGYCDMATHTCLHHRINTNIQTLCQNVFLTNIGNIQTGLLRNPPAAIKSELLQILNLCAFPGNTVPGSPRLLTMEDTTKRLKKLLLDSLIFN